MNNETWCITTNVPFNETLYLGWQDPFRGDSGYFWAFKDTILEILANSTPEHPFLFNSRKDAIKHLKTIDIPQKCRVICRVIRFS